MESEPLVYLSFLFGVVPIRVALVHLHRTIETHSSGSDPIYFFFFFLFFSAASKTKHRDQSLGHQLVIARPISLIENRVFVRYMYVLFASLFMPGPKVHVCHNNASRYSQSSAQNHGLELGSLASVSAADPTGSSSQELAISCPYRVQNPQLADWKVWYPRHIDGPHTHHPGCHKCDISTTHPDPEVLNQSQTPPSLGQASISPRSKRWLTVCGVWCGPAVCATP